MNTIEDAKNVRTLVAPLIEKYKTKKHIFSEMKPLVINLKEHVSQKDLSLNSKRAILFEFRDKGFLDYKET